MDEIKLKIPQTVSAQVQIELGNGKQIVMGTTRELKNDESLAEAHEELYQDCLESIHGILK